MKPGESAWIRVEVRVGGHGALVTSVYASGRGEVSRGTVFLPPSDWSRALQNALELSADMFACDHPIACRDVRSIEIAADEIADLRMRLAKLRAWLMGVKGIELADADLEALETIYRRIGEAQ